MGTLEISLLPLEFNTRFGRKNDEKLKMTYLNYFK